MGDSTVIKRLNQKILKPGDEGFSMPSGPVANVVPDAYAETGLIARAMAEAGLYKLKGRWFVECIREGEIAWTEDVANLITTAGVIKLMDAAFKTGLTTPAWFVGLIATNTTFLIADTMASHGSWTDSVPYSNASRPAWTPGSITGTSTVSVDNSGSPAVFNINASATVLGAFLVDVSTKSGTTGNLYAEVAFGASRSVLSGDTLNVTYTLTATPG